MLSFIPDEVCGPVCFGLDLPTLCLLLMAPLFILTSVFGWCIAWSSLVTLPDGCSQ